MMNIKTAVKKEMERREGKVNSQRREAALALSLRLHLPQKEQKAHACPAL